MAVVAIIGRPNVGKSTLFNRLIGRRLAIVDDTPGVTRDRREGEARLGHLVFTVVDTAGLERADEGSLASRMRAQTEAALEEADAAIFVVDSRAGVTPEDERFAALVRGAGKPVILVANKSEGRNPDVYDAFRLGLGEPVAISAEHGEGLADLVLALESALPETALPPEEDDDDAQPGGPLTVAIVGRPNAGKSTLINRLIGEERLLTGPEAGITRDSIAIDWTWRDRALRLVDTAGLRRKARIQDKLEKLSAADAVRTIRFAQVVIVLLDATIPFEKQDLQIADLVAREGRAIVLALNKWDLVEDRASALKAHREAADRLLAQVKGVALVPVAGKTGFGIEKLLEAVVAAYGTWNRRVPTAALNRWFAETVAAHPPPAVSGRRVKLRYATQPKTRPPHFVVFGTRTDALPESYVRYLSNGLRQAFDLPGTPIRLTFREPENPYDSKD
jgi:GTPase